MNYNRGSTSSRQVAKANNSNAVGRLTPLLRSCLEFHSMMLYWEVKHNWSAEQVASSSNDLLDIPRLLKWITNLPSYMYYKTAP